MTVPQRKATYAPRTLNLLLTLWRMNSRGITPSMSQVVIEELEGTRPLRGLMESRRQLLRMAILRGFIITGARSSGAQHTLLISTKGIRYLAHHGYPVGSHFPPPATSEGN